VDEVLGSPLLQDLLADYPRQAIIDEIRGVLEEKRQALLQGKQAEGLEEDSLSREVSARLKRRFAPSLKRVINATGVVLHTNLGRALLPPMVVERIQEIALHYSNLEYDLHQDARGDRQMHLRSLLQELTGAESSLVVNNNAAALFLILNTLAEGKEVIVSRGELIEIGGSFRLPEIMKKGGARLVEVGTTNKTYLSDYEQAIGPQTGLLLKIHTSNYRFLGFTATCSVEELVQLGKRYQLPVVEDLGSGALADLPLYRLAQEPSPKESLRAGADLVCFSGDKLLGGPQSGVILGRGDLIQKIAKNPLARTMRLDKLSLAALEATLRIYRQERGAREQIPVLAMLSTPVEVVAQRARRLIELMGAQAASAFRPQIERGTAEAGGGSLPGISLPTYWVRMKPVSISVQSLESKLREGNPPILARIKKESLILDLLTVGEEELELIANRLCELATSQIG